MPTIAEQLTQLESDRQDLVSNLQTKGITGLTGDETFTALVPEVLNIQTGGDLDGLLKNTMTNLESEATSIRDYACYNATGLQSVNLPNATSIGSSAFNNCSNITNVDLGSATSMNTNAFAGCSKLKYLTIRTNQVCTIQSTSIPNNTSIIYVYVPSNLISSYTSASNWNWLVNNYVVQLDVIND